ncbi:MAG: hypothetical protein RSC99_09835 [Clostridiales bacterium]
MPRIKSFYYTGKNQKYKGCEIPYERFKELEYFCAQYKDYQYKINECYSKTPHPPNGMPHGTITCDPTGDAAITIALYSSYVKAIEQAAIEADNIIYQDIIFALKNRGVGYNYLNMHRNIKCSKNTYYKKRADFFCILDCYLKFGTHGT